METAHTVPLRKAWIHGFQRDYYENKVNEHIPQAGTASAPVPVDWAVPAWITSNAHVARALATLILHAWSDCLHSGTLSLTHPLIVLELGAGAGTLSLLLHAELQQRLGRVLGAQARLLYVVSDFTQRMQARWHSQPALSHALRAGTLQFSTVDVLAWQGVGTGTGGEPSILLQPSGERMGPGDFINPVFAIAHYLFDSLPLDAWRVEPGQTLVEVTLAPVASSGVEKGRLVHETQWRTGQTIAPAAPGAPLAYYTPPEYHPALCSQANGVLAWYAAHALHMRMDTEHVQREWDEPAWSPDSASDDPASLPDSASFTLPLGALSCLDMLGRLCQPGGAILSCMDKGWGVPGAFIGAGPPDLHSHGSFSYMVNFHALHLASRLASAPQAPITWLHAHDDDAHVRWELALIGQALQHAPLPCMRDTWESSCRAFGPGELWDMYDLGLRAGGGASSSARSGQSGRLVGGQEEGDGSEEQEGGRLTSRAAISLCRLSNWDIDVYASMKPAISAALPSLTPPRLVTLLQGLHTMQERVQPGLGGDSSAAAHGLDVSFETGRVYQLSGHPRLALPAYLSSLSTHGPTYPTLLNLGTCCMALGQARHALAWFHKALEACSSGSSESSCSSAQQWIDIATASLAAQEGDGVGTGGEPSLLRGVRLPSGRTLMDASQL